jgi:ABC-type sugar transport system ATPase subunit
MLSINNLTKRYGKFTALDNLNMEIKKDRFMDSWGQTAPERQLPCVL